MPTPHTEHHFEASDTVRDIVIGMADGLTVPFALAAGISGASVAMNIIVTAGVAEIAAGSIAMGLGGYLAARTERQHYYAERDREEQEILTVPHRERREVIDIMAQYGVTKQECEPMLAGLERTPLAWRDFMMRFELGLEEPHPGAARKSAITIALSYLVGGLIPLAPYIFMNSTHSALTVSTIVTLLALFVFGYLKGSVTGTGALKSGLQTLLVGGLAAAAAFSIARLIS
ncbi:VIT1/CCC1 transporter family protein [Glaciimonas sp. CA11.2]|uniref:VIT1/CCC1 transporter family protein n=1 Tax=unclassified Glaciimonas TaxID=2644401 RepID=UPI002AB4BB39|nr:MULTISPECIES: VIT1/CCC1 transporter family protein [unclassified Glaciimonas]MDY7548110.1 VIT1/CCC1 transporter family protein [Glaciimonas sp. CA11.2]MEB0010277.1 VIT1/CCC1 transporter family protein [Glaciimonas sp. Cout2]MEB0084714.1 VIT1/CCC1 transporter family protein [Glaciimonas sp. Gout2]MEB0163962.1 VIT1/CCC1 transporter family protein [Glaciimonas sp. CA11.2]